jgi:hypothetical protein
MAALVNANVKVWSSQTAMLNLIKGGMSRKIAHDNIQNNTSEHTIDNVKDHLKYVDYIFKRVLLF